MGDYTDAEGFWSDDDDVLSPITLGQLIDWCGRQPEGAEIRPGLSGAHSYRGWYERLAFTPVEKTTAGRLLAEAIAANGETFTGWKGGKYKMDESSLVYGAADGCTNGPVTIEKLDEAIGRSAYEALPDDDVAALRADRDRLAGWLDRIFAEARARGIVWPFRTAPGSSEWYDARLETARERTHRIYREAVAGLTQEQLDAIYEVGVGGLKGCEPGE